MVLARIVAETDKFKKWQLADIFMEFGPCYRRTHNIPLIHHRVMRAVTNCRTSRLGGHMKKCDHCGYSHPTYNSCGNRHCPKCQSLAKFRWVEKRKEELLPAAYFHNVFTLPHDLNGLARTNKKIIYDILFKSVSHTLLEFGKNEIGGKIGFIATLHTWDQKLAQHIHLHCVIPGGALSSDKRRWISTESDNFLFSVKALSKVFRGKFICYLKDSYVKGDLIFSGKSLEYESNEGFKVLIDRLYKKEWIVYCKKPFAGPEKVLDYLGRYTFRTAISNERIKGIAAGRVTFTYRDRRDGNRKKEAVLSADEFIRRFLLHVLPNSYMRIRHYGFLANRNRKENIMLVKKLLGVSIDIGERSKQSMEEVMLELTGKDISRCPQCKVGTMVFHQLIPGFNLRTGRSCRGP
jgi:predicted Zn-ribbon and HTH transcriptional regulator